MHAPAQAPLAAPELRGRVLRSPVVSTGATVDVNVAHGALRIPKFQAQAWRLLLQWESVLTANEMHEAEARAYPAATRALEGDCTTYC